MLNRSTTWAVAFLVATFAAGLAVGAGGRALWVRYASAAAPERARGLDRLMDELNAELRLGAVQRDSVRAILQRHRTRMTAVWEKIGRASCRERLNVTIGPGILQTIKQTAMAYPTTKSTHNTT